MSTPTVSGTGPEEPSGYVQSSHIVSYTSPHPTQKSITSIADSSIARTVAWTAITTAGSSTSTSASPAGQSSQGSTGNLGDAFLNDKLLFGAVMGISFLLFALIASAYCIRSSLHKRSKRRPISFDPLAHATGFIPHGGLERDPTRSGHPSIDKHRSSDHGTADVEGSTPGHAETATNTQNLYAFPRGPLSQTPTQANYPTTFVEPPALRPHAESNPMLSRKVIGPLPAPLQQAHAATPILSQLSAQADYPTQRPQALSTPMLSPSAGDARPARTYPVSVLRRKSLPPMAASPMSTTTKQSSLVYPVSLYPAPSSEETTTSSHSGHTALQERPLWSSAAPILLSDDDGPDRRRSGEHARPPSPAGRKPSRLKKRLSGASPTRPTSQRSSLLPQTSSVSSSGCPVSLDGEELTSAASNSSHGTGRLIPEMKMPVSPVLPDTFGSDDESPMGTPEPPEARVLKVINE